MSEQGDAQSLEGAGRALQSPECLVCRAIAGVSADVDANRMLLELGFCEGFCWGLLTAAGRRAPTCAAHFTAIMNIAKTLGLDLKPIGATA